MTISTNPSIILVNPQLGENIGMVARAMLNCGLTDLRVVNPRDGWPSDTAVRAASGALDKGVIATVYETTLDAVSDLHWTLATTARPRDMIKEVYTAGSAMAETHSKIKNGQKIGVLFGAERTGLENEDIALASAIITIPLNPDFCSLNLAQAVLLVAYEFMVQADQTPEKQLMTGKTDIATAATVANFTDRIISEMGTRGFFKSPDMRPTMERNLTNLFTRHTWTDQDIQTFHGVISALIKE
jgi:tRNA/rRNA methyltransferase